MLRRTALVFMLLPLAAGCGSAPSGAPDNPKIVATTTQLADMARNIAPGAEVTSLLSPNTDPHAYEVRPDDVKALASADIVLRSGGEVDAWLDGALDSAGVDEQDVVDAGAAAGMEGDDPHWWQDPQRAEKAAVAIGAAFSRARLPDDSAAYVKRLKTLDAGVERCMDEVPAAERKLVTSHDALGYYARRYGFTVVGAAIPSLSTQAQPSAAATKRLVDQIKSEHVAAIFPESALNPKLEQAIARDAGGKVGGALYADTLGPKGSAGATYMGALAANTRTIVTALSRGRVTCAGLRP
jgi:ABC-type Zn uptake system ZnuABC Zn-binding protein ZnuA